ncbi:MAG: hypothetical protein ACP5OA_07675 [Candidatus Woesearchaeota archaeon]
MRDTEVIILNIFKNNPSKELNTEAIAKEVYSQEYNIIEDLMHSTDKKQVHDGKRRKFQLHRKILYYLNKLMDDNIIKTSRTAEKGEKYFILSAEEGDTIIGRGYKKIVITKPAASTTYIEQYETKGVMKKYEESSWINRFNSILLECSKIQDIHRLYEIMTELSTIVNDAIALNDFEIIVNSSNDNSIKEFLDKISRDTENFNKTVSIIINISQANNNIHHFLEYYTKLKSRKTNIIFNISKRDVQKCSKVLGQIFEEFSESKIKINFKNNDIVSAPHFKGRAGIYNFDEDEWNVYLKKYKGSVTSISCSQSQIALNINKFFETYKTDTEFREAVLDAAKTLLFANTIQRRKSNEYFKSMNTINYPSSTDSYKFSRDYIRFWNYDWHKDMQENNNLFELIKSTKELVETFCYSEETIFKSCGVPIRFKIAFSSAFRNFDAKFMGERDYKKFTISRAEDYYTSEIKEFLDAREKMFQIFDGGDRLRIFHKSDFAMNEIMHELGILLNAYKVPLFTYDFSGLKGTVKLTNFM